MHSLTNFHEQQRGDGCGTYGDVGDTGFEFVVTSEGEVYKQANSWWPGRDKVYDLYYSAASKTDYSNDFNTQSYDSDADVKRIMGKAVASWNDFATARKYADSVISSARKGDTKPPPSPTGAGGGEGSGEGPNFGPLIGFGVAGLAVLGLGFAIYKARGAGTGATTVTEEVK
jgi:hypothetical protein